MSDTDVIFWRRTDISGLERLALTREVDGIAVSSSLVCLEAGGFRLDHHWQLDPNWRAQRVSVERRSREQAARERADVPDDQAHGSDVEGAAAGSKITRAGSFRGRDVVKCAGQLRADPGWCQT